jgi:hypothetical protein
MAAGRSRTVAAARSFLALALAACQPQPTAAPAAANSHVERSPGESNAFDPSSEKALTDSTARLFREQSDRVRVTVLEPLTLKLEVVGTDKHDLHVSLDRMWALCRADSAGCEADVRDFVVKVVRTVTTAEPPVAPGQVVAVLRPRAFFDQIGGPSVPDFVVEPFADDLYVEYVIDLPQSFRSMVPADLASLHLTRAELAPLARANLLARLGHLDDALGTTKPGDVIVLAARTPLESSRLLLLDEWRALSAKLGQSIVVAVPAGDAAIVAIGPSGDRLDKLRDAVGPLFARAERPVSQRLFRWQGDNWGVIR